MGWKVRRPRIKIAKGLYLNLNKGGASISARSKYGSRTTNLKTGKTHTTVRTSIPGISYTTTSGSSKGKKKSSANKTASPTAYKVSGWISLIIGIIAMLMGLLSFAVGGIIILIFGIVLTLMGLTFIKTSKILLEKNNELLIWQNILLADSPNKLIMNQEQLQQLSDQQSSDDLRIVQDCIKIISNTTQPDTFFSRLDLLKEKAEHLKLLEPYIQLTGASPTSALDEVIDNEQDAIYQFIGRYFDATFEKAESMKTEKGKRNQYRKFFDSLRPYSDQMDERNLKYIEYKRRNHLI